jgi:serine/threonine-protein kinase
MWVRDMEIDVGRTVGGKYALVRLLGQGAMGEVWVAHHTSLGENVAIKLLTRAPAESFRPPPLPLNGSPSEPVEDPATAAARFRFEAQVAARLSRKTRHIARVTDHGEEGGLPYLVMELLEGETLEARIDRDGRMPAPLVTALVTQMGRALAHAHAEGVLHRDLKPANVFLTADEEGRVLVKVLDFGIARAIHAHRVPSTAYSTARGLVFGTPSYMSPEQARASSKLDQRCDLWALATIAYEALTGDLPVDGTDTDEQLGNLCAGRIVPLRARSPGMPEPLDAFFSRAFAENVADRFASAEELVEAFERAVGQPEGRGRNETLRFGLEVRGSNELPAELPASDELPGAEVEAGLAVGKRWPRGRAALVTAAAALVFVIGAAGLAWRARVRPIGGPAHLTTPTARTAAAAAVTAAAAAPSSPTTAALVVAAAPGASGARGAPASPSADPASPPPVPVTALPRAPRSVESSRVLLPRVQVGTARPGPAPAEPSAAQPRKIDKSEVF